jgi:hypothetical protein
MQTPYPEIWACYKAARKLKAVPVLILRQRAVNAGNSAAGVALGGVTWWLLTSWEAEVVRQAALLPGETIVWDGPGEDAHP